MREELGGVVRGFAVGRGRGGGGAAAEPDNTQSIGDRRIRRSCGRHDSSLLSPSALSTAAAGLVTTNGGSGTPTTERPYSNHYNVKKGLALKRYLGRRGG